MVRPTSEQLTPQHLRFPLGPLVEFLNARREADDPVDTGYKFAKALGGNLSSSGAPVTAFDRGWCDQWQADRWAIAVGFMPWDLWPWWLEAGLHPLDRLYPLDMWWRPAWTSHELPIAGQADEAAA